MSEVTDMQRWIDEAKIRLACAAVDLKRKRIVKSHWSEPAETRAKAVYEQYGAVIRSLQQLDKSLEKMERPWQR